MRFERRRSELRDEARRALMEWIRAEIDPERGPFEQDYIDPRNEDAQREAMAKSAFVQGLASSVLSEVELRLSETKSRRDLSEAISQLIEAVRTTLGARSRHEGDK